MFRGQPKGLTGGITSYGTVCYELGCLKFDDRFGMSSRELVERISFPELCDINNYGVEVEHWSNRSEMFGDIS